eukprot:scaffold267311_cov30-Tisochrysis_lutea.AAC.2
MVAVSVHLDDNGAVIDGIVLDEPGGGREARVGARLCVTQRDERRSILGGLPDGEDIHAVYLDARHVMAPRVIVVVGRAALLGGAHAVLREREGYGAGHAPPPTVLGHGRPRHLLAVVAVRGDEGVAQVACRFHPHANGLLPVVQVAEALDMLALIERVGRDLHATHAVHERVVAEELVTGDLRAGRAAVSAGAGDAPLPLELPSLSPINS